MFQTGSNLRLSQLHPLRPRHTDQSQQSIFCVDQSQSLKISQTDIQISNSRNAKAFALAFEKIVAIVSKSGCMFTPYLAWGCG